MHGIHVRYFSCAVSALNLDFLDSQLRSSKSTVHQGGSLSSVSSVNSNRDVSSRSSPHKGISSPLKELSDAQTAGPLANRKRRMSARKSLKAKINEETNDALTPIREHFEESDIRTSSPITNTRDSNLMLTNRSNTKKNTREV